MSTIQNGNPSGNINRTQDANQAQSPTPIISLGLGRRGRQWVRWAREAGAEITAIVDMHEPTLNEVGDELDIPQSQRFTTLEDAVKATGCNTVIACAPNETHEAIIRLALDLGCHILIEKPYTEDIESAKELTRLAEEQGREVVIAQQYRYSQAFGLLRQAVTQDLGAFTDGRVECHTWRPSQGMKLPLLLNQGIHQLDCVRYVMNSDPVSCIADLWNPDWNDCDGPTVAHATFRFADGARFHYSGSYVARGPITGTVGHWRFDGERGQAVYYGDQDCLRVQGETEYEHTGLRRGSYQQVALCRDFLNSVNGGPPAPTRVQDNLKSLAMVFMIEASSRLKREVTMEELLG